MLKKVEAVVREEMNRAGAIELLMPSIQPKELWDETGRWEKFGGQLLKIKDRKDAWYCYGPTHEEVITDIARNELKSYRSCRSTSTDPDQVPRRDPGRASASCARANS